MLLAQFVVRGEDREIVYLGTTYEVAFPLAQFLAMPACHTPVIDAEGGVGDDEILVDADDAAVALACGTDAHGRVEREEVVGRFLEGHSVSLHERRERNVLVGFADKEEVALAVALIESRLGRVEQARDGDRCVVGLQTVDEQEVFSLGRFVVGKEVFDVDNLIGILCLVDGNDA